MRRRTIRFLIFDLDGTLIDSYDAITESLNFALDQLGISPVNPGKVRRMVGMGLEVLVRRAAGEDRVEEGVNLFRRHYARICDHRTKLLPGVLPTLRTLQRRGYRMAVATNKPTRFTERILAALDVRPCFEFLIGPDEVSHPKPHPEMIFRILRWFQCTRWEVVYVGDMVVDVETCRSSGIPVLVLPTGSESRRRLEGAAPDRILDRFSDLPRVLREWGAGGNAPRVGREILEGARGLG